MSLIYLIRHGQASFGQKNYDRLSSTGIKQAKILGRHFACINQKFDAAYHGTLKRQRQTAEEVLKTCFKGDDDRLLPVTDEAFDEYDGFGIWKNRIPRLAEQNPRIKAELERLDTDPKVFPRLFEHVLREWMSDTSGREGEQLWTDYKAGVSKGFMNLVERHGSGKQIVVFSSGGAISVIIQKVLDLSNEKTMEISGQIMNASVTLIRYGIGRITLAGFNDITHLETIGDSDLLTYR